MPHMTDRPIALETRVEEGDRMFSPSAGRNKTDIADTLAGVLPRHAQVLEVGSGTGEHGAALADVRPDVHWQYSDPDVRSRRSQRAWASPTWPDPLELSVTSPNWSRDLPRYDVIFSANMIHIAPWDATLGLAVGAFERADTVIFYGPFLTGTSTAPSNLEFDQSLKRRNPAWGVRKLSTVKDIFAKLGFSESETISMPRNNLIVRLSKS